MNYRYSLDFAKSLDAQDSLKSYRELFHIPQHAGKDIVYLCGNSLGLQPKSTKEYLEAELTNWQNLAVEAWFEAPAKWLTYHKEMMESLAKIVGAKTKEVVPMNSLTVNLHLMMVSFYQPEKKRFKIIMEGGAFPSDQYAIETHLKFHHINPDIALIELQPRQGELCLRTEDILKTIDENADELALLMMGGINYYTGQLYDMAAIAKAAEKAGAIVGFDLAHAAGNVPLKLHDWNVDFAVWCSYKYMNSGPGGISGAYIHEKHLKNKEIPRFAGWWGYKEDTRFKMTKGFIPEASAEGWMVSTSPVLAMAAHKASLKIFDQVSMSQLREKSELLTGFLEFIIEEANKKSGKEFFQIITPHDKKQRGAQLSIIAKKNGKQIFENLVKKGIIGDWREPNVMRFSPVPLYNSFEDVFRLGEALMDLES